MDWAKHLASPLFNQSGRSSIPNVAGAKQAERALERSAMTEHDKSPIMRLSVSPCCSAELLAREDCRAQLMACT